MLLGVALIGYGTHYLARNGNCSSTGYVSYGPVPKCSGGEALYIISTFFLGPGLAVAGWMLTQIDGVLWPAVCVSAGVGLITLRADAAPGTQAFGVVSGILFLALAVLSVVLTVRKRLRPKPAVHGPAGLSAPPVLSMPAGSPPASRARSPAARGSVARGPRVRPPRTRSTGSPSSRNCATAARSPTRSSRPRRPSSSARYSRSGRQPLEHGADGLRSSSAVTGPWPC